MALFGLPKRFTDEGWDDPLRIRLREQTMARFNPNATPEQILKFGAMTKKDTEVMRQDVMNKYGTDMTQTQIQNLKTNKKLFDVTPEEIKQISGSKDFNLFGDGGSSGGGLFGGASNLLNSATKLILIGGGVYAGIKLIGNKK